MVSVGVEIPSCLIVRSVWKECILPEGVTFVSMSVGLGQSLLLHPHQRAPVEVV